MLLLLLLVQSLSIMKVFEAPPHKVVDFAYGIASNIYIFTYDTEKTLDLTVYDVTNRKYKEYNNVADSVMEYCTWSAYSVNNNNVKFYLLYYIDTPPFTPIQFREVIFEPQNDRRLKKTTRCDYLDDIIEIKRDSLSYEYERFYTEGLKTIIAREGDTNTIVLEISSPMLVFKDYEKRRYIFLEWYEDMSRGDYVFLYHVYYVDSGSLETYSKRLDKQIWDAFFYPGENDFLLLVEEGNNRLKILKIENNEGKEIGKVPGGIGYFLYYLGQVFLIVQDYEEAKTRIYKIDKNFSCVFLGEIDGIFASPINYYDYPHLVLWNEREVLLCFYHFSSVESREENKKKNKIYPTVVRDFVFIEKTEEEKVEVYNILGEKLSLRSENKIIDCRSLPAGVYFLVIYDKMGRKEVFKFVKIK